MAQNLLTIGTGELSSAEFTLDGQQEATLSLKSSSTSGGIPSNALVYIEIKDNGTSFWPVNILSSSQKMVLLTATGTYRVRRSSSSGEIGVFYTLGDTAGTAGGGGSTNGLTDTQLRASAVPVSGPLTDTQLRANPVPVSGTVTTGGLTDTQLRATALPVSLANAPLPAGGSTSALQTTGNTSLATLATNLPAKGVAAGSASLPVVPASDANIAREIYSSAPIQNKNTAATAGTFTAFDSQPCNNLMVVNPNTVDIEFRYVSTTGRMPILAGTGYLVPGITNANQVEFRRRDAASVAQTAVEVCAQAFVL